MPDYCSCPQSSVNGYELVTLVTDGDASPDRGAGLDAALEVTEVFLRRFVVMDEHAYVASTLWAAHCHGMGAWESTPRLAFLSPERQCGKSRAQEVLETLVPEPLRTSTVTPAVLYRRLSGDPPPTVFMDEVDAVWTGKGVNEELRAVINAGHRRGNDAHRMTGEGSNMTATRFRTFGALCLAGLGDLPSTIADRSVIVAMRRRLPSEGVERWRFRRHEPEGHAIRDALAREVGAANTVLAEADPSIPEQVQDRAADVWEPLLAVAEAAGGEWPQRARSACLAMTTRAAEQVSTGVRLLTDIRSVWNGSPEMDTSTLLDRLHRLEESPWGGDDRYVPLTPKRLASLLRPYGVRPHRRNDWRGYVRADLEDPWQRYCPSLGKRHHASQASPGTPSPTSCAECGGPMTAVEPGQTTHPTCDPEVEAA